MVAPILFVTLGFGLVGFLDDYIKVVKKRNLGLTAKQKTFMQLTVGIGYGRSAARGVITGYVGRIRTILLYGFA